MPNPTTIHDAAQTVLREIERDKNTTPFSIDGVSFCSCTYSENPQWDKIEMEYVERSPSQPYSDTITTVDIDETEATKLVAMILETFPRIREQFKESKPCRLTK